MTIYTSYETSKKLKEFLGKSAPKPMTKEYWAPDFLHISPLRTYPRTIDVPAYQLHDLLSKPFCEAFREKVYLSDSRKFKDLWTKREMVQILAMHFQDGGLPAVEKALLSMMEK